MEPPTSEQLKTPEKRRQEKKCWPSDQINAADDGPSWITKTPNKLPNPRRTTKYNHRHSGRAPPLPDKFEMILKFFDALDASFKLLRSRKSIPVFSKIRALIEKISDRRFTFQHLAQLKFLLPEEMGVKRVLVPDDATRCMKYDLHLKFVSILSNTKKRKRGSESACLRDLLVSRLWHFLRAHPEGTEIPEEELPEPFNQGREDQQLNTTVSPSSCSHEQMCSDIKPQPAKASHFSLSFKKHFSKGGSGNKSGVSSLIRSMSTPCVNDDELVYATAPSQVPSDQPAVPGNQKSFELGETCTEQISETKATPVKSAGTSEKFMAATPALQTPKRCRMSPDGNVSSLPKKGSCRASCARALQFDAPSKNANVVLELDDTDCSNFLEILPDTLLQSLNEREKKKIEQRKRKQALARLPKLFDRIYYLLQSPKPSVIRKEALIRDLTERHPDITDESEVEEQLKLLQETIPEWISHKPSPSGNIFYSINRALDPTILRPRLEEVV